MSGRLRSRAWFDNPAHIDNTSLYLERMLNYGLTLDELQSGRPIIGIAQTGSDITPCNRHHLALASRVRDGIREAGGIAFEFPIHPIQETCKRPTAMLDRNLQYLSLVEILYGYPTRRRRAHDRLRQDDAGAAHGRRHGRHPGHRPLRRPDAERLAQRRAHGLRARSSGRRAS